jgi:hypothetical protein
MNVLYRSGLLLLIGLASTGGICQEATGSGVTFSAIPGTTSIVVTFPVAPSKEQSTITLSGRATTARVADPNEPVLFSGRVMRMADFVAAVSSSNGAVLHPHIPEKRSHETNPLTPPSPPKD